ncbi:MAG: hypothetical protein Q8R82_18600 [Hyphomonadaceae bacterium]|nr:hypothetical protein [Hyphomonadaceae bacterium]
MAAIGRILACAALLAASASPALADIRAFNTAVQNGDYRAAVAAANETWPGIDRAGPDAASVAREFGWVAMLAGQPSTALIYAKFLVEQGGALAKPDPSPAVSRVLFDWASLAAAPVATKPQARTRLLASLQQRAAAPGRDLISARAAHALHAQAWAAGDWALAGDASMLAIRFLDELGAGQTPARFELRRGLAVSSYLRVKSVDAYNAVYDVAAELATQISTTPDGPIRQRYTSEYFASVAWGDVMYGALGAARQKTTPDRRNGIRQLADILYPAPGDTALPRCRITLARNFDNPGFPFESRFRDLGGEVIYALDVEPGGLFSNPRLLVSAPHAGFAEEVADVLTSWRWRIDGNVQPPNCRMPNVHILTFEFALGK